MSWIASLLITIGIIILSGFFVIIEFSLLAARRNRLEETAESSASSRAALRSLNELTLMLAGAQLGITAATFALGAITKPWVHHLLMPVFEALPIPTGVADALSFLLALFIVTFLHLVVGEMAPKSWAIAHPESAIKIIAIPARGFIAIFRPLLSWINHMANALVRKAGEAPVESASASGYDANTLQRLVDHSRDTGTLDAESASQITGVIALETSTVGEAIAHDDAPVILDSHATVSQVQDTARSIGHMRVLMSDDTWETPRFVHVRDTLLAAPGTPALEFSREALVLTQSTTIHEALDTMRAENQQLAVVIPDDGERRLLGVITWQYILGRLWPTIEEEIDRARA